MEIYGTSSSVILDEEFYTDQNNSDQKKFG